MKILLILLFIGCANAHMPLFAGENGFYDPFELHEVSEKSWGIYGVVDGTQWMTMDGVQAEEMAISLQRNQKEGKYDIVMWGPGLNNITCEEHWVGWEQSNIPTEYTHDVSNMPTTVQNAVLGSEYVVLKGNEIYPAEYEPFGVNVYWPLGGCKSTFPQTALYKLVIVSSEKVHYSIGVGTNEAYSTGDLLIMSYMLFGTYTWAGRPAALILIPHILIIAFVVALRCYRLTIPAQILVDIGSSLLIASGVAFLIQVLWCTTLMTLPESVWVAFIFHILMPIVFGTVILAVFNRSSTVQKILLFVAGMLMIFLAWQAYTIAGLFLCIGAGIYFTI